MRFENDGITLWIDSIDRSEVTVAVQPIDAANRVEILLQRRGQSAVERLPASWLWNDHPDDIQYFRAGLRALSPGDRYTAVCSRAGRQAPGRSKAEHTWATFSPDSILGPLALRDEHSLKKNVAAAFFAIPDQGIEEKWSCSPPYSVPDPTATYHFQGIAQRPPVSGENHTFHYLTHSHPPGCLYVVKDGIFPIQSKTVEEGYPHPGGMQAIGDYLVVPWESSETNSRGSIITFWSLADPANPVELPRLRVTQPHNGAVCVGITQYYTSSEDGQQAKRSYLMAVIAGNTIYFYRAENASLNDTSCAFASLGQKDGAWSDYQSIGLIAGDDVGESVYLVGFKTTNRDVPLFKHLDYADLFTIRVVDNDIDISGPDAKRMFCRGGRTAWYAWGEVHFTWGAGLSVLPYGRLDVLTCERNLNKDKTRCWFVMNHFWELDCSPLFPYDVNGDQPITIGGRNITTRTAPDLAPAPGGLCLLHKGYGDDYIYKAESNGTWPGGWSGEQRIRVGDKDIRTSQAPAQVFIGPEHWIAYVGHGNNYIYTAYMDGAGIWHGDKRLKGRDGQTYISGDGPAMGISRGELSVVFRDPRSDHVLEAERYNSGTDTWEVGPIIGPDFEKIRTSAAPAVAAIGGKKYWAYKGHNNDYIYLTIYDRDSASASGDQRILVNGKEIVTSAAPALTASNSRLYLAYKDAHSDRIMLAIFDERLQSWSCDLWVSAVSAGEPRGIQTSLAPTIAIYDSKIHFAYKGYVDNYIYWTRGCLPQE